MITSACRARVSATHSRLASFENSLDRCLTMSTNTTSASAPWEVPRVRADRVERLDLVETLGCSERTTVPPRLIEIGQHSMRRQQHLM